MADLDEKALRKPGFTDGVRVVLGDGQEWTIPAGVFSAEPVAGEPEGLSLSDAEVELLCGSESGSPGGRVDVLVRLAGRLLATNYDLAPRDFATLLEYDPSDPASAETWRAVVRAIQGRSSGRTYAAWLRMTLATNGAPADGLTLDRASTAAGLFVSQGRAVPAASWVDDARMKFERRKLEGMF